MKIISINKEVEIKNHDIINTDERNFYETDLDGVDYVIVSGGDGLLRRIIQSIVIEGKHKPKIIIDAQGSFNVIAKKYFVPKLEKILKKLENKEKPEVKKQDIYRLNDHIFLFSAGNMHDALHIHLSEILRIGWLKKGFLKYLISGLLVLPIAIITLPFLLFSKKRFFIFTPYKLFNFMNLYSKVNELNIDLKNEYNLIEIDGDLLIVEKKAIKIKRIDQIDIVVK